jgi:transcriptional regulator with PAS, ATPase and Fis domain
MDALPVQQLTVSRRREDRRSGVHDVVRELANDWLTTQGRADLQAGIVARLRRIVATGTVRFNEIASSPALRPGKPVRTKDYAAYAVPLSDPTRHVVLEVSVPQGQSLDDWTCQVLETAAHLATIAFDAERLAKLQHGPGMGHRDEAAPLIGSSAVMHALRERIERVATTDFTVLIDGESGTGKELVARQIHMLSRRHHGPFVAINCAALVETLIEAELFGIEERTATGVRGRRGKFEHADGGTLFLDEVAELSLAAQAKLLRAIQDLTVERVGGYGTRRVNTRIVAATNRPLGALVERGLFRADLFYRLGGVEVTVPPLRKRKEDLLELAQHFLSQHGSRGRLTMTPAAIDALMTYDWPGNVRELERLIEGAIATSDSREIGLDHLPISLRGAYGDVLMPSVQASDTMRAWGSRYARLILERCERNKRQACKVLGISYHTLNSYLKYRPSEKRAAAAAAGLAGVNGSVVTTPPAAANQTR